jgi:Ca-activated chloride channel family protein
MERLTPTFRVGAVVLSGGARVLASPTEDREAVLRPLEEIDTSQGTFIGDGVDRAMDVLERDARRFSRAPATIVLLSDGRDTGSVVPPAEAAARAHAAGVPVHTIALGQAGDAATVDAPRPADREALAALATAAGGEAFTAATDDTLTSIYDSLASRLSVERRPMELTVHFTAAGAILALIAAAASLAWLRRLP